jgi:hypothetical protein
LAEGVRLLKIVCPQPSGNIFIVGATRRAGDEGGKLCNCRQKPLPLPIDETAIADIAKWFLSTGSNELYFTSATFRDTSSRKADNFLSRASFGVDIDFKLSGWSRISEAFDAVRTACDATNNGRPDLIVATGGGLHLHWRLWDALPIDEWRGYAQDHADDLIAAGLGAALDRAPSIDPVRLLRLPPSFNQKHSPPLPVRLLPKGL